VVAVIALLVGLLLPALSRAREQGRLMICMSNERDITMAAQSYAADNANLWPVAPCWVSPDKKFVAFCSWTYGGKTTSDFWISYGMGTYRRVDQAPLNPYVDPEHTLKDPPTGQGPKVELPSYRCPSDPGTLQRDFWNSSTRPNPVATCYDDVGTSYQLNVQWWYEALRRNTQGGTSGQLWLRYEKAFAISNFRHPSRFAWLYDQSMDFIAVGGYEKLGDHGGHNKATAAFMDGHVTYLTVTPKAAETTDYTLFLER